MKRRLSSLLMLSLCLVFLGGLNLHAAEVLEVTATRSETHLKMQVKCDTVVEPLIIQCLIDDDQNQATGYTGGFDRLVEFDLLYKFNGTDPAGWTWQQLAGITRQLSGNVATYTLPLDQFTADDLRVQIRLLKSDYSQVLGQSKLVPIKLSTLPQIAQPSVEPAKPLAPAKDNRHLSARERVKQANSFYCYYGSGKVAELSVYDLAILHSPQFKRSDIATLRKQGVVTVGYISVGEDDKINQGNGKGPDGKASWYFDRDHDGMPDQNAIWKSYFANPMDPLWRANRVAEAKRLVEEDGYDGIFLDTIDTVGRFPDTEPGMVQLVRDLREALPDSPIVLNQGYSLLSQLAPLADAFMLESFTATFDFQSKQYTLNTPVSMDWHSHKVKQYVRPVLNQYPLKVLVLDYALPTDFKSIQKAADRATTFGFLFASAPIYLDDVYVNDIVGRYDPIWLEKQATPKAMSLTLPESANGFPMNTVIMPSSCYGGYSVKPVIDGIADRSSLHWSESAWASAEIPGEDIWLAFEFDAPQTAGKLQITWATDNGKAYISDRYRVQIKKDGTWYDVVEATKQSVPVSLHPLPDTTYTGVRIFQSAGDGPMTRPDLMWIAQVRLLTR
jgi:hypothetical protein